MKIGGDGSKDEAVNIGSRLELFVDEWLLADKRQVRLRLHEPRRREVTLVFDRPWEGPHSGYVTAIRHENGVRLYYRGYSPGDESEEHAVCCAESADGIRFERPRIGLYEFQGSRDNNMVLQGKDAHNFTPFLDTNPAAAAHERYKGVGGQYTTTPHLRNGSMYGYASAADGIRWKRTSERPIIVPVYAGCDEGEFTTRLVRFAGDRLLLNYATSAAGLIQVEVQDERGRPLPGLSFDDMEPMYGDELEGEARWTSGATLEAVQGKPVRFRFRMKDADLYAMRTT